MPGPGEEGAGFWGVHQTGDTICDIPFRTVKASMNWIKERNPDYIMWLGDNSDHKPSQFDVEGHYDYTRKVANEIAPLLEEKDRTKNSIQGIFPTIGNHEMYPFDQYDFQGTANQIDPKYQNDALQKTAEMLEGVMPSKDSYKMLKEKGYYSHVVDKYINNKGNEEKLSWRIISLFVETDDVLNFSLFGSEADPGNQIEWLENELAECRRLGQKAWILRHSPMGTGTQLESNKRTLWLYEVYHKYIGAVIAGHTHQDEFTMMLNQNADPKNLKEEDYIGTQWINPSITTYDSGFPSIRVYEVDKNTLEVVNFSQYRADLKEANELYDETKGEDQTPPKFKEAYNFKEHYGMAELSTKEFLKLHSRRHNLEETFMQKYHHNYFSGLPPNEITQEDKFIYKCSAYAWN
jgi:sphingomyelin phosphodiesterase